MALLIASRRHHAVGIIRRDRGWRSLLLLSALLLRRPKLVVLHFIDTPLRRTGMRGRIDAVWAPVERWALRRAMLRAQVLSAWEASLYSQRYGIERERFCFVPFAWRHPARGTPPDFAPAQDRAGVISAGRVSCDWPTLFEAARGRTWPLTVVCAAVERPLVDELNRDGRATVLSDLDGAEVQELLGKAALSVIATYDAGMSQGHVRLCASVDAGVPIVASRTLSLEGYTEDGRTAVLVPQSDSEALRAAIGRLLDNAGRRDQIARAAWDRAARWTWEDYLRGIEELLRAGPDRTQAAASASPNAVPASAASSSAGVSSAEPGSAPAGSNRREITFDTPSAPIDTP